MRRLLVVAITVALLFGALAAQARPAPLEVTVDGRVVQVSAERATVGEALEIAGARARIGVMRSAASRSPLEVAIDEADILRNGNPVLRSDAVEDGDRIVIRNGTDWVEGTVVRRVVRHGSPLPPVEERLWRQSHDGVVEQVAGEHSGEVVHETVIEAPVAATPADAREVVLTFDDGPDKRWTPMVLDILRDKGVKAVFCVVGSQMRRYPGLVKRAHAEGHEMCNHTMDHDVNLRQRSPDAIRRNIDAATALIQELTGERPRFYRAPGGNLSDFVINHVRSEGMRVSGWSIDPMDYRKPGAEMIMNRILAGAHPGAVMLLHDAGGDRSQTVAQLPALIDRLRADSYAIAVP
ncbi:MAG TPA: polysaccharide deacetylase family protein [Acidimicrobiales bacterium]|nr:polysaccharide deacetylase family protein [Acidimicrobiales bacterium]